MNDVVVWVIIIAFYAPLHYLLPVGFLFVTGSEDDGTRRRLIKSTLIDSTVSMVVAFAVVIALVTGGYLVGAMAVLLVSIFSPFIRIWRHRRELAASQVS
ncbi:MAG: hypothetical protein ACFCUG_09820 [Thiotrichales bacterium]